MLFFAPLPREARKKKRLFRFPKKENLNKRLCLVLISRLWKTTRTYYTKKIGLTTKFISNNTNRTYSQNYPRNHRLINNDCHHKRS